MGMVRTLYSVSGLSVELAKDRRTISRALASVPPDGKVGAHPGWYLLTALQALGWIGRTSDGERLDAKQERARKDKAIADLHVMKLDILRKQYVRIEHVSQFVCGAFSLVRTHCLALASRLTPYVAPETDHPRVYRLIDDAVRELLTNLSETEVIAAAENEEAD